MGAGATKGAPVWDRSAISDSRAATCGFARISSTERTAVPATSTAMKRSSTSIRSCFATHPPTRASASARCSRRDAIVAKRGSFTVSGASIAWQSRANGWSPAPESAIHPPSCVR